MKSETSHANSATAPAKSRSLYEISVDCADLDQLFETIDPDNLTDEDQARLEAFAKDLTVERDKKLDNCGGLIKEWEYMGKAQVEEGERIKALGKTKLNKAKFLKTRILGFFKFHNIEKPINTLRFTFRQQKNSAIPLVFAQSVQDDVTKLPAEFIKQVPAIDSDLIREVLTSADDPRKEMLAGLAWMGEKGEHLRVA